MDFNEEQLLAIETSNQNIIVSAGAGSGKTAVLTERIYRKILAGQDITRLLVLSFTNAAALEMKTRIKEEIEKNPELKAQAEKIDSAYITTFDSFSLSLVKKYHYLLNVSKDIKIVDSIMISLKKEKIIDEMFKELYEKSDERFFEILTKFTFKDDSSLKESLIKISEKIEKIIDKEQFLSSYITTYYSKDVIASHISNYVKECNERLKDLIKGALDIYDLVGNVSLGECLKEHIDFLKQDHTYEAIVAYFATFKMKQAPKGAKEVQTLKKAYKEELDKYQNTFLVFPDLKTIEDTLNETKTYASFIVDILIEFYKRLWKFKTKENMFEFDDISMMVLKLLKTNQNVLDEVKNSFDEILLDEYQDTSDIQEAFMNLISDNNLYMVGDIKQSIYRFRNANPYIFKEKYDKYKFNDGGCKIDLSQNYRSRSEVLDNINLLFKHLMTEVSGDADYINEHQMNFGNESYEEKSNKVEGFSYQQEYLMYEPDETNTYSNEEIEIFTIAQKIKELVNNEMQVFDKKEKCLRKMKYSDIAIILPRKNNVELIQKIFTSENIPLRLNVDEKITDSLIVRVICSLLNLVRYIYDKDNYNEYAFYFVSVARSFLFRESDELILEQSEKYYRKNPIYDIAKKVYYYSLDHSVTKTFEFMLEKFGVYESLINLGDVDKHLTVIDYLAKMVGTLMDAKYDFMDIAKHFEIIIDKDIEINYSNNAKSNGVILINIHKSKGLEYPICFFADLTAGFNRSDIKDTFLFDKDFGIITPYFKDVKESTILKTLYKNKYIKEDISEKIRLFYVALTRAREKMYFVMPKYEHLKTAASSFMFASYDNFISYYYEQAVSKYVKEIEYKDYINKNYLEFEAGGYSSKIGETDERITYNDYKFGKTIFTKKHISHEIEDLIDEATAKKLEFGTRLHEIFEIIDFNNINVEYLTDKEKEMVNKILSLDIFENIQKGKVYKELEFVYDKDGQSYHGIIDLLVEYNDHFDIIDYKLNDIDNPEYIDQLNDYYNYIKNVTNTNKCINMYLVSLIQARREEVAVKQ